MDTRRAGPGPSDRREAHKEKPVQVGVGEVRFDQREGVLLFGDGTATANRFNVLADHCRKAAEREGVGPEELAGVLVQLAAYFVGSEYDDPGRRALLAEELLRTMEAKAERAVHEVLETGFRLRPGWIDKQAGRYRNMRGESRYDETSPITLFFSVLGRAIRDYARSTYCPPAFAASDLMVIAGYHIGSNHADPERRREWLLALEMAFYRMLRQAPFQGELDRLTMADVEPKGGWRGGKAFHETDPRRGHPSSPGSSTPTRRPKNLEPAAREAAAAPRARL